MTAQQRHRMVVSVVLVGLVGLGVWGLVADPDDATTAPAGVVVTEVRAGEGVDIAAAYLTLRAGSDDALVGVTTPAAEQVHLHATAPDASMLVFDEVTLRAGAEVALVPGGDHLMLEGLTRPLEPGDEVELTLLFDRADPVTVRAPVLGYAELLEER